MRIYFEQNNKTRGYSPVGRYKKVYYNGACGAPYFRWNGRRTYFDDIPRLAYPIMLENEDGKMIVLGGYITLTNTCGVLVEMHPDGEYMRLWQEIEMDR